MEYYEERVARLRAEREERERVDHTTLLVGGERMKVVGVEYGCIDDSPKKYRVKEWRESWYGIVRSECDDLLALGDTLVVNA